MESPEAYIPIDRRFALARGEQLPERSSGAALFADISGFTPLTDALVRSLGPQRGAEELPRQLNLVYDALIADVDRYHGSVIGFSGDAITCWFDGDDGGRAVACALAMQAAMQQFAAVPIPDGSVVALSIKVAVATGPVRRFVVGDPEIQLVDVLAGATLERLAAAEHLADTGEVVLRSDGRGAWRALRGRHMARRAATTGARFAVAGGLSAGVAAAPWPRPRRLRALQTRPWLLPPVYERMRSGHGEFLTELRPAVALFLRFDGIDYDADDEAPARLDRYVRWVQSILVRYARLSDPAYRWRQRKLSVRCVGCAHDARQRCEPGSHRSSRIALVAAGASVYPQCTDRNQPRAHAYRRVRRPDGANVWGAGAGNQYGGAADAARPARRSLRQPGGAERNRPGFTWQALPPLSVKGKAEPATVFRLVAASASAGLHEPRYGLPMIGRGAELARVAEKLAAARENRGQIVAIMAEAGMGKSRLIAEIVRLAGERQFESYGGECQSYGTNNSYLVWEGLLGAFFGLRAGQTLEQQTAQLATRLSAIDPALVQRLPLLGVALNLPISDNELTASLDAKLRKASLEALLVECVRARAAQTPLLLVLEDCHWLDLLSHDLLEAIGRAIAGLPVLIVVAYRPPELERLQAPRVTQLPYCTELRSTSSAWPKRLS